MSISSETDVGAAYEGENVAAQYVQERFTSELNRLLHEQQVGTVNRIMGKNRPSHALEIAPGPGRLTRDVIPHEKLTCLEFNDGMIEEGKRACSANVQWVQGNAFELPFGEEFDFAYTFRFIRHFHREDRDRLYKQIRSVLRPDGLLVMDGVNQKVSGPMREAAPDDYPIYDKLYSDEQEIRTELHEAGFELIRCQPVQRWYAAQWKAQVLLGPRSRFLCRLAVRTLERLRRGPALEWIITCRRA